MALHKVDENLKVLRSKIEEAESYMRYVADSKAVDVLDSLLRAVDALENIVIAFNDHLEEQSKIETELGKTAGELLAQLKSNEQR